MKFDLINTLTIGTEDAPLEKSIQVTIPWFQEDLSKCLYYAFSYFNPQFAWDMCMQICVLKREQRALTVIMKDDEHIRQDINSKEVVILFIIQNIPFYCHFLEHKICHLNNVYNNFN